MGVSLRGLPPPTIPGYIQIENEASRRIKVNSLDERARTDDLDRNTSTGASRIARRFAVDVTVQKMFPMTGTICRSL
jgi:hypothetical protein